MDYNNIPPAYQGLFTPQYFDNTKQILDNSMKIGQLAIQILDKSQQQERIITAQQEHIETLKSQVKFLTWYIEHGRSEICEEW